MNNLNMIFRKKLKKSYEHIINSLIILDMFLITIALIFQIPLYVTLNIQYFDLVVCLILIVEYIINLYLSSSKKEFILDPMNMIGLIASIPFDFILMETVSQFTLLRYLRLLKLVRIFLLSSRLSFIEELFKKTHLHKILIGLITTIGLFTLLLYFFGPSYNLFDDFYFVVVTLTTVGYGDITPKTYNEKILALILILIGIIIFSTITAAISSFLTDRILKNDNEDIEEKINYIIEKCDNISYENQQLKKQIIKNERRLNMGFFRKNNQPEKSNNEILRESIDKEKNNILTKQSVDVQIPYTKSGVNDALLGSAVFGKDGALLGSLTEGTVNWRYTKLLFKDEGLYIKETGQVVLYEDLKQVVLGDKHFLNTMMTIITYNRENIILKVANFRTIALKEIIESYIPKKEEVENIDVADELLKYGDLLERGLITQEEFDELKHKLLKDNTHKVDYCKNCGYKLPEDSKFCPACGEKLNQ